MCDFLTMHSVSASDTSYPLRDFLEKFPLPQLVRVHEGYYDEFQRRTAGADTVYNLLTMESVETVLFENAEGEESRIPLGYPCAVERVAEDNFQQKLKLNDMVQDSSAVKFVRVIETDPNFEPVIKNGDKLKIAKKKSRENFVAFKKVSDKGKHLLKVPASCQATFQALWDDEEVPLAKFVKKNKLPVYVRFIDASADEDKATEDAEMRGPSKRDSNPDLPEGVVKLKGILVDSFVTATTEVEGVTSKFSFPKTLPISVVPVAAKATSKLLDVAREHTSSQKNEVGYDTKELLDDENQYMDMSGIKSLQGSPQLNKGVTLKGNSKIDAEYMTIAQLGHGGHGVRLNTYSPAPAKKVLRSKSLAMPGKVTTLLQRSTSCFHMKTNVVDSNENIYDDLNFSRALPKEVKHNPSLMHRRKSDSSTQQESKQNSSKLMHVEDQTTDEPESYQHKGEMVSFQISKITSPTLTPCTKMKTFGRKNKMAETESTSGDVHKSIFQSCSSQSLSANLLPQTTASSVKRNLFYGSEELESESTAAVSHNVLLVPKVSRSTGDALPPLPSIERSSPGGSQLPGGDHPVEGSSTRALPKPTSTTTKERFPEPPQGSNKDPNSKTQQQSLLNPTEAAKREASTSRTEEEPPAIPARIKQTGEAFRPAIRQKPTKLSVDKALASERRQPVPSPRVKPRSSSKSSQDNSSLIETNEHKSQVAPSIVHDTASRPGQGQEPTNSEDLQTTERDVSTCKSVIPKDLTTLRVPEVLECLNSLNMQQFEKIFKDRQVDGSMLVCLDEEALESFGMDRFHRLKLLKLIAGWRPQL